MKSFANMLFIVLSCGLLQAQVGIGTTTPGNVLDVNGAVSFTQGSDIVLTNGVNNVVIEDYSLFNLTGPTNTFSINSIEPLDTDVDGHLVTLVNTTTQTLTIAHNPAAGDNSILGLGGKDLTLKGQYSSVTLQYNQTLACWQVTNYSDSGVHGQSIYHSVGTTDILTNSSSFSDMTDMSITFTPNNPIVYVNFSASGHMNVTGIPQGYADFRLLNESNNLFASVTTTISDNDYPLVSTPWNVKMNMIPVQVNPGVTNTLRIQWRRDGTFPNILYNLSTTLFGISHRSFTILD